MIDKYFLDINLELTNSIGDAIVFMELEIAKEVAKAVEGAILIAVETKVKKVDLDEP